MTENISQENLDIIKKYYAYKNENMPETVPDSVIKEANEWHKNSKSFESDKDSKIEKEDKDKIKDFFDSKDEKDVSNDKDGSMCVKLKNNEQIRYHPRGNISFSEKNKTSIDTMKLALEAYENTGKGCELSIVADSKKNAEFIAKSLVAFEESGFKCKNADEFKDNKNIQLLKKKYKQERAAEMEAKSKIAENKARIVSSTRAHIENLSRNGQNQNLTPKDSATPIKPTKNKTTNANDTLKMAKERIDGQRG